MRNPAYTTRYPSQKKFVRHVAIFTVPSVTLQKWHFLKYGSDRHLAYLCRRIGRLGRHSPGRLLAYHNHHHTHDLRDRLRDTALVASRKYAPSIWGKGEGDFRDERQRHGA